MPDVTKMMSADTFEARRKAKEFVRVYITDGDAAAGAYGLREILDPEKATPEELDYWRVLVNAEFARRGYELNTPEAA